MALHEQCVGATDEWYTPAHVFEAMNARFDIDVASPGQFATPWIPAAEFLTFSSLERPWAGFVWMNPPFGARNGLVPWLAKFFEHGNGISLVPDRTSAPWWQAFAPRSDLALFISPKLKFIAASGQPGQSPAHNSARLRRSRDRGADERGQGQAWRSVQTFSCLTKDEAPCGLTETT